MTGACERRHGASTGAFFVVLWLPSFRQLDGAIRGDFGVLRGVLLAGAEPLAIAAGPHRRLFAVPPFGGGKPDGGGEALRLPVLCGGRTGTGR